MRRLALCLAPICAAAVARANLDAPEGQAQRGDASALLALAAEYKRGEHVPRDIPKSNALYCKAAALGNTDALLELGLIYSYGRGMMPDQRVGGLLINKAAALGNERAQELLPLISRGAGATLPACLTESSAQAAESPPVPHTQNEDIKRLVQHWAPEYSIDPKLVLALIAVESGFDADAISPKNAQGLMQLVPATAARFGVKDTFDAVDNLKGGLAYLRWLMAYFEGEVPLVLAAYNAGEEAVERYRGIPPFRETRNYVKQVTRLYTKARHPYLAAITAPSPALSRIKPRRLAGG